VNGKARLNQAKNSSQTKNRGRPRSRNKKDIRVSFRVDWATYKRLVSEAGGSRRLSSFIRRRLGLEA
jgi:hypothetical protein